MLENYNENHLEGTFFFFFITLNYRYFASQHIRDIAKQICSTFPMYIIYLLLVTEFPFHYTDRVYIYVYVISQRNILFISSVYYERKKTFVVVLFF